MLSRVFVAVAMVTLTALAFALVAGNEPWAGPELLKITETHGLHSADVPILLSWVAGMACCWWLWRRS